LDFSNSDTRVIDPNENAKDRAEVQKTMEGEVLRVSQFLRISFESTFIELADGAERFRVRAKARERETREPSAI